MGYRGQLRCGVLMREVRVYGRGQGAHRDGPGFGGRSLWSVLRGDRSSWGGYWWQGRRFWRRVCLAVGFRGMVDSPNRTCFRKRQAKRNRRSSLDSNSVSSRGGRVMILVKPLLVMKSRKLSMS